MLRDTAMEEVNSELPSPKAGQVQPNRNTFLLTVSGLSPSHSSTFKSIPMNFLLNIDSLQTLNRQQPSDRLRVKFMFDRMNESE